jgi:hypothetical protein
MNKIKIVGATLGIGTALYILFAAVVMLGPYVANYSNRTEFDSVRWKNWKESENEMSLRWNMIDDLEDDHKLYGMTFDEIITLLGEPDSKSTVEWTYYLGMAGHGIDTGTLALTFEKGRVKSYKTYRG